MSQKYFHSDDTYTLLIFHQNQKGTSNKFCPRNIFIPMIPILYLYFIINKKEQAINFVPEIFHFHDTYTLLIFHHKQKEQAIINLPWKITFFFV